MDNVINQNFSNYIMYLIILCICNSSLVNKEMGKIRDLKVIPVIKINDINFFYHTCDPRIKVLNLLVTTNL